MADVIDTSQYTTTIPDFGVNHASWITINGKLSIANTPNSIFTKIAQTAGLQTTPQTARGVMSGSAIDYMNNNLIHSCDFRFLVNIDLGLGSLISLFGTIPNAIKNAKNKAARVLSDLIKDFMKLIFAALKAIQEGLSFDGTGLISISVNKVKQLVADIQDIVDYIAQKVEDVMAVVYFIQDVQNLINWILSLPQHIINMVIGCLNQFKSSLDAAINQVKSLPGQVTSVVVSTANSIKSTIDSVTNSVTSSFQGITNSLQSGGSSYSSSLDPSVSSALNNSVNNPTSVDAHTSIASSLVDVVHNNNNTQLSSVNPLPQNNPPASSTTSTNSGGGNISNRGNGRP